MGRSRRIKVFSYRIDLTQTSTEDKAKEIADWWDGFEFVTGPVMVFWKGPGIGQLQVWAISESEGRGVIEHALAHMGADPSLGKWRTAYVDNDRYGQTYTARVSSVSCRQGPSGPATTVITDHFCTKDWVQLPPGS
jgi:hypothetical protein